MPAAPGSEPRSDCGAARPLAADSSRRLNASNHLSDLIRGGMSGAVLINADLDGWMDGHPRAPLLHPHTPPHHHQYHQRRPPPNQLMAGWADVFQISDL